MTLLVDRVRRMSVWGTVQGVGFRPFVYRLATELGLAGSVRNAGGHVEIVVAGPAPALDEFARRLRDQAPPHAVVERLTVEAAAGRPAPGFVVLDSSAGTAANGIPPDLATCPACLNELFDPADRRHRYPFVNCTACGPRATIVDGLPYDRERTSMRAFPMCDDCAREYADPADRRFHAEPIACPACGPRLSWHRGPALARGSVALYMAEWALRFGGVIAIKGLGGYQLVCDATCEAAVARIRRVKARPAKPVAIMVPDLATAHRLAWLTRQDERDLLSAAAPIVLAEAPHSTSPDFPDVGLFLPYTPLHHLLLADLRRPLVVTSANRADEPMVIDDETALRELEPLVDGVLAHDRPIVARHDDSVVKAGRLVRRARGYAPAPLPLPVRVTAPILAVGAQLKHTFAVADGDRVTLSPHLGDLENEAALDAFEHAIEGMSPAVVAHDLHPGYLSTQMARRWPDRVAVQHHHAHVAAVAAEHGIDGPFLGVAYDGLGMGDDGTFWGGELLLADFTGYRRLARFSHAPMPGGAVAVRRPDRMALGYLLGGERFDDDPIDVPDTEDVEVVRKMIERGINTPLASSAGRLFDALAALLGVCRRNRFEGEAAMRLEALALPYATAEPLAWRIHERDGLLVYDAVATLRDALAAVAAGESVGRVSAAFHATLAAVTLLLCERADAGIRTVCLSGGVFQNRLLTREVTRRLTEAGYRVFTGERVPVNDGGISYGQAVIAAATRL
ncbi:carbamoyltransferase HypF [Streptosporangiaceae bacterium NEAU-GS5]|nr:carbamoyltransferase HypF [Streptosporangiaceae bacterium NEAU-GS5]